MIHSSRLTRQHIFLWSEDAERQSTMIQLHGQGDKTGMVSSWRAGHFTSQLSRRSIVVVIDWVAGG